MKSPAVSDVANAAPIASIASAVGAASVGQEVSVIGVVLFLRAKKIVNRDQINRSSGAHQQVFWDFARKIGKSQINPCPGAAVREHCHSRPQLRLAPGHAHR